MSTTTSKPIVRVPVHCVVAEHGHLAAERIDVGWSSKPRDCTAWSTTAYLPLAYPNAAWAQSTGTSHHLIVLEGHEPAVTVAAKRYGIGPTARITTGTYTAYLMRCTSGSVTSLHLGGGVVRRGAGDVTLDHGQPTPFGVARLDGAGLGFAALPDRLRTATAPRAAATPRLAVPPSGAGREDVETTPKWTSPREDLSFTEHDAVIELEDMAGQEASRIDDHERDDLMQEALLAVVRAHRAFPYTSTFQFAGYARRAAHNALIDYTREHNRERHERLVEQDGWEWPHLHGIIDLRGALAATPHAELLVLHAAGYTDAENATRLDIGPAAATKRRQRANDHLAELLDLEVT